MVVTKTNNELCDFAKVQKRSKSKRKIAAEMKKKERVEDTMSLKRRGPAGSCAQDLPITSQILHQ